MTEPKTITDPVTGEVIPLVEVETSSGVIHVREDVYNSIRFAAHGLEKFHPETAEATLRAWDDEGESYPS